MGALAFILLFLLLLLRKNGGAGLTPPKVDLSPAPGAGEGKGPLVPQPVPIPKPTFDPDVKDDELRITADCKSVDVGATWWDNVAKPDVVALVENGVGLPVYTETQADLSIDAAVRTIVAKSAGVQCVQNAPWLDRWVKQHPVPRPKAGETREQYNLRLEAWDDTWDATISAWASAHPQLFDLFKKVGALVYQAWAISRGVNPGYYGTAGQLPKGVSSAEAKALLELGYDHGPIVVEVFQADYNLVKNYQSNFGWSQQQLDIEVDNVVGPQTRAALKDALSLDAAFGGWPAVLEAARNG